jgi:hypothetical protein
MGIGCLESIMKPYGIKSLINKLSAPHTIADTTHTGVLQCL